METELALSGSSMPLMRSYRCFKGLFREPGDNCLTRLLVFLCFYDFCILKRKKNYEWKSGWSEVKALCVYWEVTYVLKNCFVTQVMFNLHFCILTVEKKPITTWLTWGNSHYKSALRVDENCCCIDELFREPSDNLTPPHLGREKGPIKTRLNIDNTQ